jgi:hypothetical protein
MLLHQPPASILQPVSRRRPTQKELAAAPAWLALKLQGGLRRAHNPSGTHARSEVCCRSKHARQVAALHHTQLVVHISKADGTMLSCSGVSGVDSFTEDSHGAGTEPPQGFKRDRAKRLSRAVVVGIVVLELVGTLNSSVVARSVD